MVILNVLYNYIYLHLSIMLMLVLLVPTRRKQYLLISPCTFPFSFITPWISDTDQFDIKLTSPSSGFHLLDNQTTASIEACIKKNVDMIDYRYIVKLLPFWLQSLCRHDLSPNHCRAWLQFHLPWPENTIAKNFMSK